MKTNHYLRHLGQYLSLLVLLLMCSATVSAADFISNINTASKKYGFGHRVIYEMNVGAFTSAGTFNAAAGKLSSLKDLGVDVVWLMPIYKRDGGMNSPYAPAAMKTPNPSYGTIDDLRNLVNTAHSLNMEIWLDWVPNHTANNHPWLNLHPDYYSGNLHPFYSDVSQLDYASTAMRNAMTDIMKYWIDQADIDGFRCDFVSSYFIPNDYWTSTIPTLKNYKSGKTITMLGEADFTDCTRLLDTPFDYDYAWWFQETALWKTVGSGSSASSLKSVCDQLVGDSRYSNKSRMVYLTNHDVNFNHNVTLSNMYGANKYAFTVLTFTLYGMPLLYNGQEEGGEQVLNYFTDSKVNWNNRDNKMYNTVRTLTALKHSVEAFQDGKTMADRGTVRWIKSDGSVAAYIRKHGNSEALVVLNLGGATTVTLNGVTAGTYTQWLDSKTISNGVKQTTVTLSANPSISLDNRGYAVYVLGSASSGSGNSGSGNSGSSTGKVTINVKSNHATPNIWAWNDGGNLVDGGWPGPQLTATNSDGWKYKTFNADKVSFKLSNNGSQQSGDLFNVTADSYYYYVGNGITSASNMEYNSGEKVVYFSNNTGDDWSSVSCYAWGSGGESLGSWPGKAATQVGTVNIYDEGSSSVITRKLWKVDVSNAPEGANLIFNNKGGGQQVSDVSCQYGLYYSVNGSIVVSPKKAQAKTVTIYVKSNHNGLNIWAWNGSTNLVEGSWPGPRLSQKNSSGWYSYTFTTDKVSFKFNDNGNQQTGEVYDVTADSYYYYVDGALIKANDIAHSSGEKVVFFCNMNGDDYSAISCYAWGSGNESLGSWPGKAATQCGTAYLYNNGTYTRKIWKLSIPNTPEGANLIFNNNNGGWQMSDVSCQYGVLYTGSASFASAKGMTLNLDVDGEATAINSVNAKTENAQWYTLSGVKISQPTQPGIYIRSGRKVVVR